MRIRKINSANYNIIFDDIKIDSLKKDSFDFVIQLKNIQKLDKAISEMCIT